MSSHSQEFHYQIKTIDQHQAATLWDQLWPERIGQQKWMSSMTASGDYDLAIYSQFTPMFWGLFRDAQLVGVLSGHGTSAEDYRIRGLYLSSEVRGQQRSHLLFSAAASYAKSKGHKRIWSYPKHQALKAYEGFGFKKIIGLNETKTHSYVEFFI